MSVRASLIAGVSATHRLVANSVAKDFSVGETNGAQVLACGQSVSQDVSSPVAF